MGNVTPQKAETIRQYVLDCSIRRLTALETTEYLRNNGFPIDVRTVKRYRTRIRESAQSWVETLARSKRSEYVAEYKERIDEVRAYQRELWNIYNDKATFQRVKVEAISKLMDCTGQLVELFDSLPLINSIRDWGCGYNHDHDDDNNNDLLQHHQTKK